MPDDAPQERDRIATPAGVVTLRDGEWAMLDHAYRFRVKFLRGRGQRVELEVVAVPQLGANAAPKPYLSREGR